MVIINSLPDDILCHILSFLWRKEAALTSLLSKRWRNLFAFSPSLCFEEKFSVYQSYDLDNPLSFKYFLDRVLAVSGNNPIRNFSLTCKNGAHINLWIRNVLGRGVLERLYLDVHSHDLVASLPLEVFTCKTLVTLKLEGRFNIAMIPDNASMPALKTLFLDRVRFSNPKVCGFEALISACPVLEELVMLKVESVNCTHCTVSSPTLQRFTYKECGDFPTSYRVVNLDSVIKAKLSFTSYPSDSEHLIKGLSNVQILKLSSSHTMKTFYSLRQAIPVFKNLFHLSIATATYDCCPALPLLITKSPNLETLVIKGGLHYVIWRNITPPESICKCLSGYSCLLPCPVKVLEITLPGKTKSRLPYSEIDFQLGQLKHFLEKLSCLELVKVRSRDTKEKEKLRFTTDLLNLPRSSKCKIQLEYIPPS